MITDKNIPRYDFFDSSNLLDFFLKFRKRISIITLSAGVLAAIVSYIIEPKYKSTVILYPTTTVSISKTLFKDWDDALKFGEEKEAEQILQILYSDFIREKISAKYGLTDHYHIDTASKFKRLYLKLEFEDRVSFQRTPYNSIQIDVLDRSPDTAAFIANDIANLIDSMKNNLFKERALKVLQIVEEEYNTKNTLVNKLEDSLLFYTKQGIFDYETQSGIIFKEYSKSIRSNNGGSENKLDQKMKLLGANGYNYVALRDNAYHERNEMFGLRSKLDQAKIDVQRSLPSKYIINPAVPAEKKTYPIRWLIVIISMTTTLLLSIVILSAMEKVKTTEAFSAIKTKA